LSCPPPPFLELGDPPVEPAGHPLQVIFDRIEPVLGTVNLPGKVPDRIFPEHLVPEAGNRRRVVQLGLPELFLYKRFWFRPGCTLWSRLFFRIFIRVPACPSYSLILVMPGT
jgi:hypothetical protein